MPNTKTRAVRIDDEIWKAAQERAQLEHRSLSDVIRIALIMYASGAYDARVKRKRS